MTGINTSSVSQPWVPQAAKIAAASVNASGGVLGRPVQIDVCDDHSTPQGASVCAQKLLVQDKVLMMVGDDGTQEPALIPTLAAAKTISWSSLGASLDSLKSPNVYILEPVLVGYWILPQMLPTTTKKVAYISADTAIAESGEKASAAFYPKSITVTPFQVSETSTNFQPTCLQIKQSGADTAVAATNPNQIASLIQTCNQIGLTKLVWAIPSIEMSPEVVKTVTELHQPNLTVLAFGKPAVDGFAADVAAYGPKVGGITNTVADSGINAWLGVKLFAKIVPQVGSVDAMKIKTWLDQQKAFDTGGATAPVNFTTTAVAALPRVKNLSASEGEISGGKLIVTNPTPFSAHLP